MMVSPRSTRFNDNNDVMINKPPTPYDDRVIPTLRNSQKSRLDKESELKSVNKLNLDQNNLQNGSTLRILSEEEDSSSNNLMNDSQAPDPNSNPPETFNNNADPEAYDPMDGTEEMTEREVREAALMNDFLGKQIVTKLYSKNFQNREDAIQEVYKNLQNYQSDNKEEAKAMFRAAAILVAKMCKDNVFSIFTNTIKLLDFLLREFAKKHSSIGKHDINYLLEKVLPVLLHRTGDTNARLRQCAQDYIVKMANFPELKPLHTVPNYCTIPIQLHIAPRLALSRVEIIEDLMKTLGTKDHGLNVENISKFCGQALEHTAGEVRELAAKILIEIYKVWNSSFNFRIFVNLYLKNDSLFLRSTVMWSVNMFHKTVK